MDIKTMEYFKAVAEERSFSKAAQLLHMTQPPLSRSIKELEMELGKTLFVRVHNGVELTEEGIILKSRIDEILELTDKTIREVKGHSEQVSGEVTISAGESNGMHYIASAIKQVHDEYPNIRFHVNSAYSYDTREKVQSGMADVGIVFSNHHLDNLEYYRLPHDDLIGIILPKDHPLAEKKVVRPEDLKHLPLMGSRHIVESKSFTSWLGYDPHSLDISVSYNLINTPILFMEDGLGYPLAFMDVVNLPDHLCQKPLYPHLKYPMILIWKKNIVLQRHVQIFLDTLKNM